MNNLNTVLVEGKLVRDPSLKMVTANCPMCRMSIANNRYYIKNEKWEEDTSFFSIIVYGDVALLCDKYLKKGRGIRVVGRLKQYKDTRDLAMPREQVSIIAEHIEFQPERQSMSNSSKYEQIPKGINDATFGGSMEDGLGKNGEIVADENAKSVPLDECTENTPCTVESTDEREQAEIDKEQGQNPEAEAERGPESFNFDGGSRGDAQEQLVAGDEPF